MADITMCRDVHCPLKENCYRQTAKANEYRQSVFVKSPMDYKTKECKYFWANKGHN